MSSALRDAGPPVNGGTLERRLRIGIVAPLWAPVPPREYGGIERHLHLLSEELTRRGHAVTLFATGDSRTSAELRATYHVAVAEAMDRGEACAYEHYLNATLADALRMSGRFDVLHLHVGSAALPLTELAQCEVLHTLHTGVTVDDLWALRRYPDAAVTVLTRRQLAPVPDERRGSIRVVPYGFDFDSCGCAGEAREHLVFLGRMAPHKGPDEAIRIARAAGRPIWLAGAPVTAEERRWFQREIQPAIDGESVVWLGPVDDAAKDELFGRALAFLFPIKWEEPFGLVMLEALARGVPVLAYRRGSVPEVVDPGETGWVADSPAELAKLVEHAARLDRQCVREHAKARFSHLRMTDAYVDVYRSLVSSRRGGGS
jgi:glycosyltransferase involved in cell wall biosynthesis